MEEEGGQETEMSLRSCSRRAHQEAEDLLRAEVRGARGRVLTRGEAEAADIQTAAVAGAGAEIEIEYDRRQSRPSALATRVRCAKYIAAEEACFASPAVLHASDA